MRCPLSEPPVLRAGVITGHLEFCRFGPGGVSKEQRHQVHEESCRGVLVDAQVRCLRPRSVAQAPRPAAATPQPWHFSRSTPARLRQGRTVFTCSTDKSICAFDLAAGTVSARLENAHKEGINRMCFVAPTVLATGAAPLPPPLRRPPQHGQTVPQRGAPAASAAATRRVVP